MLAIVEPINAPSKDLYRFFTFPIPKSIFMISVVDFLSYLDELFYPKIFYINFELSVVPELILEFITPPLLPASVFLTVAFPLVITGVLFLKSKPVPPALFPQIFTGLLPPVDTFLLGPTEVIFGWLDMFGLVAILKSYVCFFLSIPPTSGVY